MSTRVRLFRRTSQVLVLAFLVLVPVLAWHGSRDASSVAETALHDARARWNDVDGDVWSTHLFGLSLLDPLGGAEALVSRRASLTLLLASLAVPVGLTLLLGRVFCSWICPAGFLFEMTDHVRRKLARAGLSPGNARLWRGHKYVLLLVGVSLSALVGIPLLAHVYPPALIAREMHRSIFDGLEAHRAGAGGLALVSVTGATLFVLGIVLVEIFVSRRFWCRSLCPGGALYSLIGRGRIVRVRRVVSRCTECADCIAACPIGLDPMRDRTGTECDNCQECIVSCPEGALRLSASFTGKPLARAGPRESAGDS